MNFVAQLNTVFCQCGLELYREDLRLPFDGLLGFRDEDAVCSSCRARIESEVMAERNADFRWLSRGWLTRELIQTPVHILVDEKWHAENLTSGSAGSTAGNTVVAAPSGSVACPPAQPDVRLICNRIVANILARLPVAMQRAKQLQERAHDCEITSSDRDTRRSA